MPDSKITALTALTAADPANDMIPIVDVSDTPPASGNTKRISINNILAASGTATLASATITGDLTVDTSTLKVDSTNNRVGIGTASPTGVADFLSAVVGNSNVLTIGNNEYGAATYLNSNSVSLTFNRGPSFKTGAVVSSNVTSGNLSEGYIAFQTSTSNVLTERYRIDNTGISTWSVGGSTAMTLNATGLGVGKTPLARLDVASARAASVIGGIVGTTGTGSVNDEVQFLIKNVNTASGQNNGAGIGGLLEASASNKSSLLFYVDNGTAVTNVGRFDSNGNLLVGSALPVSGGRISGNSSTGPAGRFFSSAGDNQFAAMFDKSSATNTTSQFLIGFTINNQATGSGQINANGASQAAFGTFSDSRLKENIVSLPSQLANILSLRPVEFDYKDGSGHQIGFVAQEMHEVYSDAVGEQNGFLTVTGWSKTEARLVSAIKELAAKVQALEAKLA